MFSDQVYVTADVSVSNSYIQFSGVPRLNTPPLLSNVTPATTQELKIAAPKPLRISPYLANRIEDLPQPWTRSPTKSKTEPVLATWHFVPPDPIQSDGLTDTGMPFFLIVTEDHVLRK